LLAAIVEGRRRDYLNLADVSVPIEYLYALAVTDIIHQFEKRSSEGQWTDAEKLCNSGWDLHVAGREDDALEQLDAAIRLAPRFCLAWINKGIVLKAMARFEDALACYDHILDAIDPQNERARYNKAVALLARAEEDDDLTEEGLEDVIREAIGVLDKALEVDPEYAKRQPV
jgi:tetratricopeptide (TPR) repeat protein